MCVWLSSVAFLHFLHAIPFVLHILRTKCNACFEIAKDIEAAKFVLKQPSNNAVIIEDICAHIPSNHMPYAWIESFCDEIMDDFAGKT